MPWQRGYCHWNLGRPYCVVAACLGRRYCHVTALLSMLRRPVSAATSLCMFWACSKLGGNLGDLGDLTVIHSAPTALFEISHRPSGDLADFADRSKVTVLCDWGIRDANTTVDLKRLGPTWCKWKKDYRCHLLRWKTMGMKFSPTLWT